MKLLSIIVPIYNVEDYLSECLDSLLKQDYPNIEYILVDDGSTDNSLEIAKNYLNRDHRIKLYTKPNGGLSDARNYGIDHANGEYIAFVDSDDVILGNDVYSSSIKILEFDSTINVVQFRTIYKWGASDLEKKDNAPVMKYSTKEDITRGYLEGRIHCGCCDKVFKREIFNKIRFRKGQISEDIYLLPELIEQINSIYVSDIGWYAYRYRLGSISKSTFNAEKDLSSIYSYCRFWNFAILINKQTNQKTVYERFIPFIWNKIAEIKLYSPNLINNLNTASLLEKFTILKWFKCYAFSKHRDLILIVKALLLSLGGTHFVPKARIDKTH